jgi:hypothetical protein
VNSGLQQLLSLTEQDIVGMCKQDLDARYVYRMLLRVKGEPEQAKVPPAVAAKEVSSPPPSLYLPFLKGFVPSHVYLRFSRCPCAG